MNQGTKDLRRLCGIYGIIRQSDVKATLNYLLQTISQQKPNGNGRLLYDSKAELEKLAERYADGRSQVEFPGTFQRLMITNGELCDDMIRVINTATGRLHLRADQLKDLAHSA